MHFFHDKNGHLHAESRSCEALAQLYGTPLYIYSARTLRRHVKVMQDALTGLDHLIAYAVKANDAIGVLRCIAESGAGADIVSLGELKRVRLAGIPAEKIIFSGVGKTSEELAALIQEGVGQINVESAEELQELSQLASNLGKKIEIALRLNPNVSAGGHANISTGKDDDKFGIPLEQAQQLFAQYQQHEFLNLQAVAIHIGSQISDLAPFRAAIRKLWEFVQQLQNSGHRIKRIDVGGGLAVPYSEGDMPALPVEYGKMLGEILAQFDGKIIVEPGRLIAANAGILLTRVIRVKQGKHKKFVITDAGMNDLLRPALYEAYHQIRAVQQVSPNDATQLYDIVGPICESSDFFGKDRQLPTVKPGDLLAIMSAGAYGFVQASRYNSRALPRELLVDGDHVVQLRPFQTVDAQITEENAFFRGQ